MIYLSSFLPLFCPSCGTSTRLERVDNPNAARFKVKQALDCPICGVRFQFADRHEILRAATHAGGDLLDRVTDEELGE